MSKVINTQGKRKSAIGRCSLKAGKGKVTLNGQILSAVNNDILKLRISEPLVLAGETAHSIDLDINVKGGGISGQADAARLAMARALVQHDSKLRSIFEEYDRLLLVADVRRKETRKPNDSKARAKRQKSYR